MTRERRTPTHELKYFGKPATKLAVEAPFASDEDKKRKKRQTQKAYLDDQSEEYAYDKAPNKASFHACDPAWIAEVSDKEKQTQEEHQEWLGRNRAILVEFMALLTDRKQSIFIMYYGLGWVSADIEQAVRRGDKTVHKELTEIRGQFIAFRKKKASAG